MIRLLQNLWPVKSTRVGFLIFQNAHFLLQKLPTRQMLATGCLQLQFQWELSAGMLRLLLVLLTRCLFDSIKVMTHKVISTQRLGRALLIFHHLGHLF